MTHIMEVSEDSVTGKGKYKNAKGNTECVVFVQAVTDVPNQTANWVKSIYVMDAKADAIKRGTAIATFDEGGKYPTDELGKHAAIYLSHSAAGIKVLDQWNAQGEVLPRLIRAGRPAGTKRSNDAAWFYVID